MNDRIPCRVSIEELAHDRGLQEYSPEDLKDAREEIVEGIIGNTNGLNGTLLWQVLQEWLNVDARLYDERLSVIAKHLQTLLHGAILEPMHWMSFDERRKAAHAEARSEAEEWLSEIVRESITEEMVEERAAKIAAEKLEDASI